MATRGSQDAPDDQYRRNVPAIDKIFTDFGGVNVQSPRNCIGDNELAWCENAMPFSPGNLKTVETYLDIGVDFSTIYTMTAYIAAVPYLFGFASGKLYVVNLTSQALTTITVSDWSASVPVTQAIAYTSSNGVQGILIVGPNGYYDYNITSTGSVTRIAVDAEFTIASYAGRVWVANTNNTVQFTDVASYNSFGGAGGSFLIQDSYIGAGITALFSAFGFLYIFGASSIDQLSNVQVTSGTTSFTRTNIVTTIGVESPSSLVVYNRALMFATNYGLYALSGATPTKISDPIDGLFEPDGGGLGQTPSCGSLVTIFGVQCVCWILQIIDRYTTLYGTNTTRNLIIVFAKGKWFFLYPGFDFACMCSLNGDGNTGATDESNALFGTRASNGELYQMACDLGGTAAQHFIRTKLWDGGQMLFIKEVISAGLGLYYNSDGIAPPATLTVTTDNEFGSTAVSAITSFVESGNWQWLTGSASTMNGKFFGMSILGDNPLITYTHFAEQYRETRQWR